MKRAETLAILVDPEDLNGLSGDEFDLTNPTYLHLKDQMTEIREISVATRFVYLMKQTNDGVIFLVDSEPETSEDYSPPGQVYDEATEQLLNAFALGESGLEVAGDRWGVWLTGYAPILDQNGQVIGLLGIDLDYYTNYLIPVILYSSIPLATFLVLLVIILYEKKIQRIKRNALVERERLMRFATHEIGTPMTELSWICQNLLSNGLVKRDDSISSSVQQMYISTVTLARRITNLLHAADLTSSWELKINNVDVVPLINEAIETHKEVARIKNISINLVHPLPDKATTRGNLAYLNLVFSNLIAHSLYYAKEYKSIEVDYKDDGKFHQISVTSIGDSLKEMELNSLFSAYYKGEPLSHHTESTGLGLFLIQKVVDLYGGSVKATSDNLGVTISVQLPKV